jgi:hypothetical protein
MASKRTTHLGTPSLKEQIMEGNDNSVNGKQSLKLVGTAAVKKEAWGWLWRRHIEHRPEGEGTWELQINNPGWSAKFWKRAEEARWGGDGQLLLATERGWERFQPGVTSGATLVDPWDGSVYSWSGRWNTVSVRNSIVHEWTGRGDRGWGAA